MLQDLIDLFYNFFQGEKKVDSSKRRGYEKGGENCRDRKKNGEEGTNRTTLWD